MISIFDNTEDLSVAVAELFVKSAKDAINEKRTFTVALTGGSSPVRLYQLLAGPAYSRQIEWSKVYVFWGDERWVPLDDDKSNAKMTREALLDHLPVKPGGIFPMYSAEQGPEEYATEYEQLIKRTIGDRAGLDLILLGMGDDGHTASLFPGTKVLHEETKWVDSYYLGPQSMYRITFTAPFINQAKKIAVITYGTKKAHALHEVLEGERNFEKYPSQLLNPGSGELNWFVDREAASGLSKPEK